MVTQKLSKKNYLPVVKALNKINRNKRDINYLIKVSNNYNIPINLAISIYLLEVSNRPLFFRLGENLVLIISLFLNLLFGIPFKNYTIGKCQIGISSILRYHKYNVYLHTPKIYIIKIKHVFLILRALFVKTNIDIFASILNTKFNKVKTDDLHKSVRLTGISYNGKLVYGLYCEEIFKILDKSHSE